MSLILLRHGRRVPNFVIARTLTSARPRDDKEGSFLNPRFRPFRSHHRNFGGFIPTALRSILKIRYLLLGGAVGGGLKMKDTYDSWTAALPSMEWINGLMRNTELEKYGQSVLKAAESIKGKASEIDIDPVVAKAMGHASGFRNWFDKRLEYAMKQSEVSDDKAIEAQEEKAGPPDKSSKLEDIRSSISSGISNFSLRSVGGSGSSDDEKLAEEKKKTGNEKKKNDELRKKLDSVHDELMKTQIRYMKELDKLEGENKELKKRLLLKPNSVASMKQVKKSLIDMYSDVLDELSGYDLSYNSGDQLPRVVVVGDQSSGKTSVLEMVAQARIFPRGAGEMMTRAPVYVTLSEGPYHIASFKDSANEYDLTKESDLFELRKEVERRMQKSVLSGQTISKEPISMSVQGPGLQRMVLVDLPGIISTVTTGMDPKARENIKSLAAHYMSNPNAIILCIQDGSVDAERSNVTDLVSSMDPSGKRTIFVLTKVDLAEKNHAHPERISKILSGELFPMKALGYFAVVTGKGSSDDTIQDIKDYEEKFFESSKIFKGSINPSQFTTRNLSSAVSECFWKMVLDTVGQQADSFKATRFNLEMEWKNNFPRIRELDRNELFEKARGEILDEVVNLSHVSSHIWEDLIYNKLWEKLGPYVIENIYLPAAQSRYGGKKLPISSNNQTGSFNTAVDIRLKQWAESYLGQKCVEVGWEVLSDRFNRFLYESINKPHDDIFDELKSAVFEEAVNRHKWEEKAGDMLKIIQLNALEDDSVRDKEHWNSSISFLEESLTGKAKSNDEYIKEEVGPSMTEKILYWRSASELQSIKKNVESELKKFIKTDHHKPQLTYDEMTTVKKNLSNQGVDTDNETIRRVWQPIYKKFLLDDALKRCGDCKKGFYAYLKGIVMEYDCGDVVLFWRIQQMLKITAKSLRQQIVNRECKRFEKEIKEILEEFSQDPEKKVKLLTGRRVQLAEELKRVKQIQEKLEKFIHSLNTEKE